MKHQPFETWILLDEILEPEQQAALNEHLRSCRQCQKLAQAQREITTLFQSSLTPSPEAGFTARWQDRLVKKDQARKWKTTWLLLGILSFTLLITAVGLGIEIFPLFNHTPHLLAAAISEAAVWTNLLIALQKLFLPLIRISFKMIPMTWVIVSTTACSGAALFWFVSLSRTTFMVKEVSQ